MSRLHDTKYLVKVAFLGTLGFCSCIWSFSSFMPPFLKFDFGDVPALIAGFAYGPVAGVQPKLSRCYFSFFPALQSRHYWHVG